MVGVTDRNWGSAVGAGLLGVLFAMTALLAVVGSDRSSEPSRPALPPTPRFSPTTTTFAALPTTTGIVVPTTTIPTSRPCATGDLQLVSGTEFGPVMQQARAYFGLKNTASASRRLRPC